MMMFSVLYDDVLCSVGSRESGVGAVDLPGTNLHTYTGYLWFSLGLG